MNIFQLIKKKLISLFGKKETVEKFRQRLNEMDWPQLQAERMRLRKEIAEIPTGSKQFNDYLLRIEIVKNELSKKAYDMMFDKEQAVGEMEVKIKNLSSTVGNYKVALNQLDYPRTDSHNNQVRRSVLNKIARRRRRNRIAKDSRRKNRA